MKLTLITPSTRTMPAVSAAVARHRSEQGRHAEAGRLGDAVAVLALTVAEMMPTIVRVISPDQAERLRAALVAVRGA